MDSIMAETERLAYFTVVHALDLNSLHRSSNSNSGDAKTEQRLQACVLKMLERHSIVFSGMMQRLHISRSVNFRDSFSEISEELFKDEVSWSKIVALFALGARLGQHCRDNHMEDLVEDVAISLAAYAKERITPFIQQEGGWVSGHLLFTPLKSICCDFRALCVKSSRSRRTTRAKCGEDSS